MAGCKNTILFIWCIYGMGKNSFYSQVWCNLYYVSPCISFIDESTRVYQLGTFKNAKGQNYSLRCLHDLLLVDVVCIAQSTGIPQRVCSVKSVDFPGFHWRLN